MNISNRPLQTLFKFNEKLESGTEYTFIDLDKSLTVHYSIRE